MKDNLEASSRQLIPPIPDLPGVSAYVIKPDQSLESTPQGWQLNKKDNFNNSVLTNETMIAGSMTKLGFTIKSYEMPKSAYIVYVLMTGKGKFKVNGGEFTSVKNKGNYFKWHKIGMSNETKEVNIEVAPATYPVKIAGFIASGEKLPIIPVSNVFKKLKEGESVTIALYGDSVTENAKGFRGGASKFNKGNPGLLKNMLEKKARTEAIYISHRDLPGWPENSNVPLSEYKTTEFLGQKCRDGRVDFPKQGKIQIVNMSKGGAASDTGWIRFPETFTEETSWHKINDQWVDSADQKMPSILRWGLSHYKPNLVIINFGTNDANSSNVGRTAEDVLFFLKIMTTMIQHDLKSSIILSTPHKWTRGTHQFPHTQPEIADVIRNYCRKTGIKLADVYNEYGPNDYDDIHPGDIGHANIVAAYWKALIGKKSIPAITYNATVKQLKDNKNGTITDTKNKLMWMKDANSAKKMILHEDTKQIIQKLNTEKFAGYSDWHLPSRQELLMLVNQSQRAPALPKGQPFENVQRCYFSSTAETKVAYVLDFKTGIAYFTAIQNSKASILPVRNVKTIE